MKHSDWLKSLAKSNQSALLQHSIGMLKYDNDINSSLGQSLIGFNYTYGPLNFYEAFPQYGLI